eukprot:TRINITY_DN1361_c0_g1_i3.p2 TRINITY_DN1361_c0_g1~~TRINITY_DN1361_c0_g1_i3.p2  ORF type:complete len:197 (-),score=7.05 TRINITY_DN1361_c0_g1_i3:38-628(-)
MSSHWHWSLWMVRASLRTQCMRRGRSFGSLLLFLRSAIKSNAVELARSLESHYPDPIASSRQAASGTIIWTFNTHICRCLLKFDNIDVSQTPPAAPPTRPPNPNPPQQQPHPPASAPFSHVPVVAPEPPETAPTSAPATQLAPDNSNIIGNPPSIFYSPVFDILIGVGAGAVVVLITGVIWWRCHVKTRYRYRAIG